jgi:hypothetical protein
MPRAGRAPVRRSLGIAAAAVALLLAACGSEPTPTGTAARSTVEADGSAAPRETTAAGHGKAARGRVCPSKKPHTPDAADLWGGCWPGPKTVGIPRGTRLSAYTGPCTITSAGTTIEGKQVDCALRIQVADVKITKSKITGGISIDADWPNDFKVTVRDSEIDAMDTREALYNGNRGIGKNNFVVERSHLYGGISGAWCEFNCVIRDSYIHGQGTDRWGCTALDGTPHVCLHESGIRLGSGPKGNGQLVEHSTVVCDAPQVEDAVSGANDSSGCSASVTGYGDFAPIRNNRVHRNLFLPSTGGACVYGGSTGKDGSKRYGAKARGNTFTQNVFVKPAGRAACGSYFTSTDYGERLPDNAWTGNKLWDAQVSRLVGQPPNR